MFSVMHSSNYCNKLTIPCVSCNLKIQDHCDLCISVSQPADPNATLSDHILSAVLSLLRKEVSEHGRHLQQYFHLFLMYLNLGTPEVSIDLFKSNFVRLVYSNQDCF